MFDIRRIKKQEGMKTRESEKYVQKCKKQNYENPVAISCGIGKSKYMTTIELMLKGG